MEPWASNTRATAESRIPRANSPERDAPSPKANFFTRSCPRFSALLSSRATSQFEVGGDQSPNVEREQGREAEHSQPYVAINHLKNRPAVHFGKQAGIGEVHSFNLAKWKILER